MAILAAAILPAALLEDQNAVAAILFHHGRRHAGARHGRRANGKPRFGRDGEHIMQRYRGPRFGIKPFNGEHGVWRDAILFPAGADYCIGHGDAPKLFQKRDWLAFTDGKSHPPRTRSAEPEEAGI